MKNWLMLVTIMALVTTGGLAQDDDAENEGEGSTPVTTREALPDESGFQILEIAAGFWFPLGVTHSGDGTGRVFVVEQTGTIWALINGERLPGPFLDISSRVSQDVLLGYSERGLLGLAFHPDYEENGRFFVHYADPVGTVRIVEYRVSEDDPNRADPNSARELLAIPEPDALHNGGQLAFGPDGYLYIGLGDGGGFVDPSRTGQNPSDHLAAILRIDVDKADPIYGIPDDNPYIEHDNFAPEVWAYGLRNPWRFSFDRATGDLYIGDVGLVTYEEVNFQPADSRGGENYGWSALEGPEIAEGWTDPLPEDAIDPVATYGHDQGCAITGGYVYRGAGIPELTAAYIYGDYCMGNIWAAYRDEDGEWHSGVITTQQRGVTSFGEDEAGELYAVDYYGGRLLKFFAKG